MSMVQKFIRISENDFSKADKDPKFVSELQFNSNQSKLNIDQTWDGLHYLLTGKSLQEADRKSPLSWAIAGNQELGEEDTYGKPRVLSIEEVIQAAKALENISEDDLRQNFKPDEMFEEDIYPPVWDEPHVVDWLNENFNKLKEFYSAAVKEREAVFSWIE